MTGRAPRHLRVLPAPGAHGPAHLHLPRVGDADHRRPVHRPDHAARLVEFEPVHRGRGRLPREPGAVSDRARLRAPGEARGLGEVSAAVTRQWTGTSNANL